MKSLSMFGTNDTKASDVAPPTDEGGAFSHIAPVTMRMLACVSVENAHYLSVDIDAQAGQPNPQGTLFTSAMGENWTKFYFTSKEVAKKFCAILPKRTTKDGSREYPHNAQMIWHMMYWAADVLNVEDIPGLATRHEKSDGVIVGDRVQVKSYDKRAVSNRHQFHLMALPSAVSAVARFQGYDVPQFDLSELTSSQPYSESEYERLCHGEDWRESILYTQRAELWAALGEPNADAYIPTSMQARKRANKYVTTAAALDEILTHVIYCSWQDPIWCRVATFSDPHPDALYEYDDDEGETQHRHSRISIIVDVFGDEETAIQAAMADYESGEGQLAPRLIGAEATAVSTASHYDWPDLPEDYSDGDLTVQDLLSDLAEYSNESARGAAKALGITVGEVKEWRDAVEANT